ncbi:hypothetical protein GCM10025780_08380 [Frondihabitans cladoniiphilus]|uniref:Uncharacterized protein n=2 Tax=Frondihabitans cladoniiphilus TaxID=715785 RepID=A0ABP8VQM2_9MICO
MITISGVGTVAAYSSLMTLQALVLDPLAAVPGRSLRQIHAHLLASGMNVTSDNVSVIVSASIGVALSVTVAAVAINRRLSSVLMAVLFLSIVALGALVTFGSGFALGMDIADSYGGGGGSHTVWAPVLYGTSFLAFLALVAVLAVRLLRGRSAQGLAKS